MSLSSTANTWLLTSVILQLEGQLLSALTLAVTFYKQFPLTLQLFTMHTAQLFLALQLKLNWQFNWFYFLLFIWQFNNFQCFNLKIISTAVPLHPVPTDTSTTYSAYSLLCSSTIIEINWKFNWFNLLHFSWQFNCIQLLLQWLIKVLSFKLTTQLHTVLKVNFYIISGTTLQVILTVLNFNFNWHLSSFQGTHLNLFWPWIDIWTFFSYSSNDSSTAFISNTLTDDSRLQFNCFHLLLIC